MAEFPGFEITALPVGEFYASPTVVTYMPTTTVPGIGSYVDGYSKGFNDGAATAAPGDLPNAVAFFGGNMSGPLTTLTPTWVCYFNAVTELSQPAPPVSHVGNGTYKFTPTGNSPAGILDLGSAASPRYLVYASISSKKVFAAFDVDGEPLSGLTPTWVSLKRVSDETDYPQPSITSLGFGLYATDWIAEHTTGVIFLGSSAFPQYYHYDSESGEAFIDGYADGELYGFSSLREERMQPIAPGETDVLKKTITFMVYTDTGLPASGNPGEGAVVTPGAGEIQVNKNLAGYVNASGTFAHIADGKYRYVFHDNEVSGATEGYVLFRLKKTGIRTITLEIPLRVATATAASAATIIGTTASIQTTTTELHKIAVGRWKIFNNQLTLYDVDGTTPMRVFDLLDDEENPSQTKIFERLPVP